MFYWMRFCPTSVLPGVLLRDKRSGDRKPLVGDWRFCVHTEVFAVLSYLNKQRKLKEAQGFLTKIINNNCPQLGAYSKGERGEERLNLTLAAFVVPFAAAGPDVASAVATVTKEVATTGMSVVLTQPIEAEEVLLGIRWDSQPTFFRCQIKHQSPIGAGLWQTGLSADEIVQQGEYPALGMLEF
jgi:hypothetical protein